MAGEGAVDTTMPMSAQHPCCFSLYPQPSNQGLMSTLDAVKKFKDDQVKYLSSPLPPCPSPPPLPSTITNTTTHPPLRHSLCPSPLPRALCPRLML